MFFLVTGVGFPVSGPKSKTPRGVSTVAHPYDDAWLEKIRVDKQVWIIDVTLDYAYLYFVKQRAKISSEKPSWGLFVALRGLRGGFGGPRGLPRRSWRAFWGAREGSETEKK